MAGQSNEYLLFKLAIGLDKKGGKLDLNYEVFSFN